MIFVSFLKIQYDNGWIELGIQNQVESGDALFKTEGAKFQTPFASLFLIFDIINRVVFSVLTCSDQESKFYQLQNTMARSVYVSVDHDKCVGSSICAFICPQVYRLNKNCQSTVLHPDDDIAEGVLEAAKNCPASAITVTDAETGRKLFPLPESPLQLGGHKKFIALK